MLRVVLLALVAVAVLAAPADAARRKCTGREIPRPRVVSEQLPPAFPAALELLRRPQAPEERLDNAENGFGGDMGKVAPATMRLFARTQRFAFYVVGATVGFERMARRCRQRLSRAARRREQRAWRRQLGRPLQLAYVSLSGEFTRGAGFFGSLADVRANRAILTEEAVDPPAGVVAGLVPDGVASVEASFLPACSDAPATDRTLAVTGNGWIAEFPAQTSAPFRTVWRAADGSVVAQFSRPPRRGGCSDEG
jgi:hypothetical protein